MLAVQTADHLLYVPERDIASITPVYPNRSRVVLGNGTVAHRPGQQRWLNPEHLTRSQGQWQDPADYLYTYEPLADPEEPAESDGVCWLERVKRKVFWHTDDGVQECETRFDQTLKSNPELCLINRNQAVALDRIRLVWPGPSQEEYTITLDNGAQLIVSQARTPALAYALGCDTLKAIDAGDSPWLAELRDTPYDMLTAPVERVRADFPNFRRLVLNLLWRSVLLHQKGQLPATLKSSDDLFFGPVSSLAQRLGYPVDQHLFENTFKVFVSRQELADFRQLGFADPGPGHRLLGSRHPDTVLLAPLGQKDVALAAARRSGISCYLAQGSKRLHLEFFAQALGEAKITRIRLLVWNLDGKTVGFLREDLEQCGLTIIETRHVDHPELETEPGPIPPLSPPIAAQPYTRVALQSPDGLLLVEPGQIASWMPAHPARWRVVSADGSIAYHPGPVPSGPWVRLERGWVRPQLLKGGADPAGFRLANQALSDGPVPPLADHPIVRLERRDGQVFWHHRDGGQIPTDLPIEEAAQLHPDLLRLNHDNYINRHHLRATYKKNHVYHLTLEDGSQLPARPGRHNYQLASQLGLKDLFELEPDLQLLRHLQIRDYPYEIALAKAAVLRADFATPDPLIANVLWQAYCMYTDTGKRPYADDFNGFFYRPLQATLYRAGFLTRAQMLRSPQKDRLFYRYEYLLNQMVRRCRLFNYQQFGFKDANPDQRILGSLRPGLVMLVEKGGIIEEYARRLQLEFGLTLLLLGGMPSLRDSEYFERALAEVYQGPLDVLAYTDFDNSGWRIGSGFVKQMEFLGRPCRSRQHVVQAACFSLEEQLLHARPLPMGTPEQASNVANWVRETGGVGGQPLGIHANWLQPYCRVLNRVQEML